MHLAAAALVAPVHPVWRWTADPARRWWAVPVVWGLVAAAVLLPFDGVLLGTARSIPLGGDVRRELEAVQQYGGFGSLVLVALLVYLLDRQRAKRLYDLLLAVLIAGAGVNLMKMLIGRPRPRLAGFGDGPALYDHLSFLGPFGEHPFGAEVGVRHAWEFWAPISSDLHSMPSSHTAFAVVLSVFLWAAYPRLRGFAVVMPVVVGCCRVLFGAHYPSDVVVGAAAGFVLAYPAIHGGWGRGLAERARSEDSDTARPEA